MNGARRLRNLPGQCN
ncbi:hypothetical protein [Enterobacter cloacae]|nr:hypothetical protein [Enterobacter cloacae]MCK7386451.1 hypothetical protein [Enterobacter cloacae]